MKYRRWLGILEISLDCVSYLRVWERSQNRHVSKLAAAANFAFPRNSRFFVPRVATFKTVYVFNIAKTIFREMLTVFLYIVLIRKSRLITHMQILMMRNDYQANKKEPKLRSTKSSSYFFQWKGIYFEIKRIFDSFYFDK